ncbi:L-type lectin-domain containing receptor kinase IX.1-like [Argentina anserina]|uniref:L-type lectin-domain containing receptor kinase IX.1-like n=1 Tax=Argentina anserina TaxID=57926 RepID=UPI0021762BE6|nr:L-type lectin-domain containing receptor kinase IX.1-like [Potentilla anserina]
MHEIMSATFHLHSIILIFLLIIPLCHPLSFSINHFDETTTKILYEGDAAPSSNGSGIIELNTADFCRVGRATHAEPLHLWEGSSLAADFTTNFSFVVDTLNQSFADGFVFYLAPVHYPIPPNSAGQDLGLYNTTTRFAESNQLVTVEFDTLSNPWDPPGPHIGINDKTISSVVHASWDPKLHSGKECRARITYNATTNNLILLWTYEQSLAAEFSSLSLNIDLRKSLPEWVTIRFSSATGLLFERHVISSWEFSSSDIESGASRRRIDLNIRVTAAAAVLLLILMLCVAYWWVVRKRMKRARGYGNEEDDTSSVASDIQILALPRQFTYQELVAATNGFANDRRLGQGGSGQVYKGIIQDLGCAVAVKRIFAQSDKNYEKIFINEARIISRIIHKSLVQFIGWCHEQGECLLVYAYMPNSSLDTHLFGPKATLQWEFRYRIAQGLASALHYLHEDAEQCVLHRDIKSANILLDNDFSTKLGDFGIAKLVDPRLRTQNTGVVGTFGYMAPEYIAQGRASKESDMFSFGVVAFEIACGMRTYQDGEFHLPLYIRVWHLYLSGNILDAADERLGVDFDQNEMECLLMVGLWCCNPNSKERPKAGQVMKVLQLEAPLPNLPHIMPHYPMHQSQRQTQSGSSQSQLSLTSSLNIVGR